MSRLPDLITDLDLPLAELHAAKLDGLVLPVATGFRAIDRPDGRTERITAIAADVPERMIVSEESAAWIWGALVEAPEPLRLCARTRARARLALSGVRVAREVRIGDDEVTTLITSADHPVCVTTPLRTVIDLARAGGRDSAAAALVAMLSGGFARAEPAIAFFDTTTGLPGRRAAMAATPHRSTT